MNQDRASFASESYLQAKALWKGERFYRRRRAGGAADRRTQPYGKGRDPQSLSSVIEVMASDLGWTLHLEQHLVITEWPSLVGADIAEHAEVLSIQGSILHVQCDSTAWATELRRLRPDILTKLLSVYPDCGITDITFHGPHAPSWRHGYRRVQGRGPRDTYG